MSGRVVVMGRLSLAIGRQKEGSDGRNSKTKHFRSSLKGLLGIPGGERASVDLGDIGDYSGENSVLRGSQHFFSPHVAAGEAKSTANPISAPPKAESGFSDVHKGHKSKNFGPAFGSAPGASCHSIAATVTTAAEKDSGSDAQPVSCAPPHARAEIAPQLRAPRSSVGIDRELARVESDADKHGWRRRGSMLSSRLAVPLRKEAASGGPGLLAHGSHPILRQGSVAQLDTPSQRQQQQHSASHSETPETTGRSPFWRGSSALRIASGALASEPLPASAPEIAALQERTHRSSSVPFFTPLPSTGNTRPQAASAVGGKAQASPYLRAVSSGLGKYTSGGRRQSQNVATAAAGFSSTHPTQDRFPRLSLPGNHDGSSPPGSPMHTELVASGDKAATAMPMTFLVSPRPRAGTGTKHGIAVAAQSLGRTPSRDLELCKRTLSSTTITSLELNALSSPKALSGGVDMSEFGVALSATAAQLATASSNAELPPSPISTSTPAQSVNSVPAGGTFEPLRESAEDELGRQGSATEDVARGAPALDPAGDEPTDAVHETHHMEVQHDPRTGRKMINQYMIIRELGRGTHGKVKLAFDTTSGEYYAIKIIDKEPRGRRLRPGPSNGRLRIDVDKMEKVKREIAILKKCRHPNVVRLREVIDDAHARRIYLVIEYMDGGEIAWRDSDHLPLMTADRARSVFRGLVLGVEYLHYVGILHRDLKPQNLLCSKAGAVKISDFGVSFLSRKMSRHRLDQAASANSAVSASSTAEPTASHSLQAGRSHLHHYASQPLMGGMFARPPEGSALRHRSSALSRGSESSSLRIHTQRNRLQQQVRIQSAASLLQPAGQSSRHETTMGMTNEFGARKGSLPLPAQLSGIPEHSDPMLGSASAGASPVCKLPPEFLSADSNVYDPFDSSDSDEFFSSEDEESDYGSQFARRAFGNNDNSEEPSSAGVSEPSKLAAESSADEDSESGIVFGVLPQKSEGEAAPRGRHQRKGTLDDIDFAYDEKDEERELAKTAGTPAFFAPELCCMPDELAKVLKDDRMRRLARSKLESQDASSSRRCHTIQSSGATSGDAGSGATANSNTRPASLFVESPVVAGADGSRGPQVIAKRHSALTSLLSRPFSSRGRLSTGGSGGGGSPQRSVLLSSSRPDDADISTDDELDQPLPTTLITPSIDIWAMGVTLYCFIYGRVPFQASTEFELFNIIPRQPLEFPQYLDVFEDSGSEAHDLAPMFGGELGAESANPKPTRRVQLPPLDPDLRDLLSRLLDKDFRTRITIDEIKHHPWVVKDLDRPSSWAKETDPARRPSLTITSQEVEQAMVPKLRQRRGFRATVRHRISMLSPRTSRSQRQQQQQHFHQSRSGTARAKSSLDWLKIWQ
ncbi:hypothetical protein H4R20_001644 [Coemansia guatemalensis]|uniref:non-specific serine/threonine protein kinase n=1 Tax=Coemansia guatemalensis TaxID=2761395 RepID=A0A9W8LVT1_9FUNG|nr:hypothetical protein H4R20_001644 [Coemansia guatemalensis]